LTSNSEYDRRAERRKGGRRKVELTYPNGVLVLYQTYMVLAEE